MRSTLVRRTALRRLSGLSGRRRRRRRPDLRRGHAHATGREAAHDRVGGDALGPGSSGNVRGRRGPPCGGGRTSRRPRRRRSRAGRPATASATTSTRDDAGDQDGRARRRGSTRRRCGASRRGRARSGGPGPRRGGPATRSSPARMRSRALVAAHPLVGAVLGAADLPRASPRAVSCRRSRARPRPPCGRGSDGPCRGVVGVVDAHAGGLRSLLHVVGTPCEARRRHMITNGRTP